MSMLTERSKTMESQKVPELRKLALHADLQAHLNSHIVGAALKKTKDWLQTSGYLTAGDAENCCDFSDIWKILSRELHIEIGKYHFLKDLCNRIEGLKCMVHEIEKRTRVQESTIESRVEMIYHADLQAAMNSYIVGPTLKLAKDWLLASEHITPRNMLYCNDFSDIWKTLYGLTLISVGKYDLLKMLCCTIGLKRMVPVIEGYEDKITQVHDGNAKLEDMPPLLQSSPISDRQDSVFDEDMPPTFVLSDLARIFSKVRQDEVTCDTPPLWSSSRADSRASSSVVRGHIEMKSAIGDDHDDDDNGKWNESMGLPEEAFIDKIRRWRPVHRTSSLPNLHTHDQGHTFIDSTELVSPFTQSSGMPRRRCATERHTKLDSYDHVTRSPSVGILHHYSNQANRPKMPYTPSESSLYAESESFRELVLNRLDDLDSSKQSECGSVPDSVKSEPVYFEVGGSTNRKNRCQSTASLPCLHERRNTANNNNNKSDWLGIVQDSQEDDILRVENYIQEKLQSNVQLKMINQHLTHVAIYVQIATLALCHEKWDWMSRLKKCLSDLYLLNNLWSLMIDDCQYSATKIAETFDNILLNLSNESVALVQCDKQTMMKHISLIKENVDEIMEVTLRIEYAIRRILQDIACFISKEGRSDLQKLVPIVLSKVNPILWKCRIIVEQLVSELEQWCTEDIKTIDSGLNHVNNNVQTKVEKKRYKECMEENKIRWMALKQHCHINSQKHGETRRLLQDVYKDDPTPGITTTMKTWRLW